MTFIGISLLAVGLLVTYLCRKELLLGWVSRRWPQTSGRISGRVVHEWIGQGMGTDGTLAPVNQRFREADLVFTYSVAGQEYQSSQFSLSAANWQDNTQYYNEGDEVTVFYCPTTPSTSVLRPGLRATLLLGPVLLAVGVAFLAYPLCSN